MASIQQEYPELVACGMMSFIQQDPDTLEPMPGSQGGPGSQQSSQTSLRALPSTRAGALVSSSSARQRAVLVPQIIFLYQLVEGVADKSFGEEGAQFPLPLFQSVQALLISPPSKSCERDSGKSSDT